MRVESLTLKDFKSYQDADLDLSGVQLASVVGANGAGKSSLLEAIAFALTGARSMRNLDQFIRQGAEECRVALTFSTGGEIYRLTRTRSSRGSGKSTLELARQDESGLWAAEGTGARDTEERVRQILGCDEDTLLQTAIVSQGDAGSFFALRPAQRLEALGSILRLDEAFGPLESHFRAAAAEAKTSLETARRDVERLEADVVRLEHRREDLAEAQRSVERAEQSAEADEAALAEAREALSLAREAAASYALAVAKRDELTKRQEDLRLRIGGLDREAHDLDGRIEAREILEAELAGKDDLEAKRDHLLQCQEEDFLAEADRRRLTDAVNAAESAVFQARDDWKAAERTRDAACTSYIEAERAEARRARALEQAQDRLAMVEEAERPICDRCGQDIADAARERTLASMRAEIESLAEQRLAAREAMDRAAAHLAPSMDAVAELTTRGVEAKFTLEARQSELAALPEPTFMPHELDDVEDKLRALEKIPAQLAQISALEERLATVAAERESLSLALQEPALVAALAEAEQAVSVAQGARARATEAEAKVQRAEDALSGSRQRLSEADKAAARLEGEVASLALCREQLTDAQAAAKTHAEEQADAEILRKAMGKWGVPALIVGNVLLSLEVEVNELLSLYEGSLALRFESERETGNGARDSLEIIVYDGQDWRPFETFSGGERYRVASAMRLGLARLLAHRSGARVSTLIVDEPEGLDAPGRAHLAAILARMAEDFGIVLLLTHYEDLKDAMPQQIVVSRGEDGLSRVAVGR
ncbi:MAG: AAA family ATPase [Thermoleophilia bacterium]